ncbi:hypothetical protein EBR43_07235 [bacterium]|jgi:hypothetical protein|nr:hypothetical protein [bacterium]NBW57562.1 hypothetical protein [bacterium]NBX71954.1 hypothetical protein [bacterium]
MLKKISYNYLHRISGGTVDLKKTPTSLGHYREFIPYDNGNKTINQNVIINAQNYRLVVSSIGNYQLYPGINFYGIIPYLSNEFDQKNSDYHVIRYSDGCILEAIYSKGD